MERDKGRILADLRGSNLLTILLFKSFRFFRVPCSWFYDLIYMYIRVNPLHPRHPRSIAVILT